MIVNVVTDDGTTVEIIQSSLPNVVEVFEATLPNVIEVVTAGPQGPRGPAGDTTIAASFVTTSSFNAFTSSYNTGSFTGSFIGALLGTASWATNALTASYLEGYISPFPFTGSALITGSLELTGSLNVTGSIVLNGVDLLTNQSIFSQTGSYWNTTRNIGITGSFQLALNGVDQYFAVSVAGEEKIKVNTEGTLQLTPQDSAPTAVSGGIFYSSSNEFYLGFNN